MPKPGFLLVLILLAGGLFALVQKQELNHRRDLARRSTVLPSAGLARSGACWSAVVMPKTAPPSFML